MLPASIKSAGVITMGSDISFPPMESYDQGQPAGFDIDLGDDIAAELGVKAKFVDTGFGGIIPALEANRFDLILSSMTDSKAREQAINFVDYLNVGSALLVQGGNPKHLTSIGDDLCGLTMAGQTGTNAAMIAQAQASACAKAGKAKLTVLSFPDQSSVILAIESGRADAAALDYTGAVGYVQQDQSKTLAIASTSQQNPAPYGIGIMKSNTQLQNAVQAALRALIANGTYKSLLAKWGLSADSLTTAKINGAVS
jgi:polar amino acid transport system substrate-binding protein